MCLLNEHEPLLTLFNIRLPFMLLKSFTVTSFPCWEHFNGLAILLTFLLFYVSFYHLFYYFHIMWHLFTVPVFLFWIKMNTNKSHFNTNAKKKNKRCWISVLKSHEKFSWKMLTWDNYFSIKISKYDSLVLKIIQNCYYVAFWHSML